MLSILNIRTVAKYEIKTLLRSWFFRIFSLLTIATLIFFNLMVITDVGPNPPWMFRAIPASIPYFNLLIFNLVQAVIIVFLASDFLKRDKKLDTTDVIYIRSMSNADYVLGKTIGILAVFFLLNIAVLVLALTYNFIQTDTPVIWEAYLLYPVIICLPTLIFITGLSFFSMVILKNQAITFIILLGYIASTLFLLANKYHHIFDYMAFKLPLMYSDFVGFGNLEEILIQRSIYLFAGLAFILLTIISLKRLPQSQSMNKASMVFVMVFMAISIYEAINYMSINFTNNSLKSQMIELNNEWRNEGILLITDYDLEIDHEGDQISGTARMSFINNNEKPLGKLIFSLNPSLEVDEFLLDGQSIPFERKAHTIFAQSGSPLEGGKVGEISIKYHGSINDRTGYLDVDEEALESNYRLALMNIDKRHGFINEEFVLLTPEILWYPISGVTYSPENPTFQNKQFSKYTLTVKTGPGLKVISQGKETEISDGFVSFAETIPLTQISLTIGNYIKKSMEVDSVMFNLYYLEGHDFYSPFVSELEDTLSTMLGEIKQDYERDLNLDYYYKRFSVVEVPIQFYSYSRRFASYQEVVQPQMVFVPEKCAILRQADFRGSYTREKSRVEKNNQAISDKEIQARILNRFITGTFTSGFSRPRFNLRGGDQAEIARALSTTSIYKNFPNYYSFIYYVKSGEWSVLNRAFESYLLSENENMMSIIRRRVGGLSGDEVANQALEERSFEEILKGESDKALMDEVIKIKGNYLFALIQNKIGIEAFDNFLSEILRAHKFKGLDISVFNRALKDQFDFDLEPYLEDWLKTDKMPGFILSNVNAYEIRDGENTKFQVLFTITNEENVDGLVTVSFRTMNSVGRGGGFGDWAPSLDLEKIIHLEPNRKKEVGIVLDAEPRLMAINTLISKNVPSAISHFFSKIDLNEKMSPFDGERNDVIADEDKNQFEIIVDNEDEGFELIEPKNENQLKKWLKIDNTPEGQKYIGIRINRPPSNWRATARPEFYGKYVLSAYITKKGTGDKSAVWNADIPESGMHEIYYFVGKLPQRGRGRPVGGAAGQRRNQGNQQNNPTAGPYQLTIFHDDGEDEVTIDVDKAEEGWNLLGNFYLSSGKAKVSMSNETEGRFVIADAVKWVRVN